MIGMNWFSWLANRAPSTASQRADDPGAGPLHHKDGHNLPRRQPLGLEDRHFALLLHHHHPQR